MERYMILQTPSAKCLLKADENDIYTLTTNSGSIELHISQERQLIYWLYAKRVCFDSEFRVREENEWCFSRFLRILFKRKYEDINIEYSTDYIESFITQFKDDHPLIPISLDESRVIPSNANSDEVYRLFNPQLALLNEMNRGVMTIHKSLEEKLINALVASGDFEEFKKFFKTGISDEVVRNFLRYCDDREFLLAFCADHGISLCFNFYLIATSGENEVAAAKDELRYKVNSHKKPKDSIYVDLLIFFVLFAAFMPGIILLFFSENLFTEVCGLGFIVFELMWAVFRHQTICDETRYCINKIERRAKYAAFSLPIALISTLTSFLGYLVCCFMIGDQKITEAYTTAAILMGLPCLIMALVATFYLLRYNGKAD